MIGLRVISYGGGVQSTALLVLAVTGRIDFRTFLFANVGNDSEDPATLDYIAREAAPYAAANGIALHQLHRVPTRGAHKGEVETLYGRLTRDGSRSLPIPVRMSDTGAPGTRSCTADFKIRVIGRWLRDHGACIVDRTGDPGSVQGCAGFAPDGTVKLAVVGDTVCRRRWHECACPLAHVNADTLAGLDVLARRAVLE